jgi:hypothetical protein
MRWCSILFGNSELSLRLPNLLAHVIYLGCTLLLLKRLHYPVLQMTGFALLNLNPFSLDFFFLARGYGLALAFMMLSLYLFTRAYEERRQVGFVKNLYLCVLAGSLAVLSNFAFLNYYLPLLLASAWLLFSDASLRRFSRRHVTAAFALFSTSGIFLVFILFRTRQLKRAGEFYFGGHTGFISDTVGSLVRASLYSMTYSTETNKFVSAILVAMFIMLLILGLYLLFSRKDVPLCGVLLMMLSLAVALPILQHYRLHILFPKDRAALYYITLYALVLLSTLYLLARRSRRYWQKLITLSLSAAIGSVLICHFCLSFTAHSCYNWPFDAHNKEILEIVDHDRERNFPNRMVKLGDSWLMEPSLNFYRFTRNYTWLAPMTRMPISVVDNDYIYAFENEVQEIPTGSVIRLVSYADTKTVLLRVGEEEESRDGRRK